MFRLRIGSAARGIVPFALGTDTAGSGRVPAGFNNIVGLKPTRGWFSTSGVVPACRTLDCVSILTLTVSDAEFVAGIMAGFDETDPYSRLRPVTAPLEFPDRLRFAVPATPEFFGDREAADAFGRSLDVARRLGAQIVPVDFAPFLELATMLYTGPWVAERLTAITEFLELRPSAVHPTVREIIVKGRAFSACDFFKAEYHRAELARRIARVMNTVDALLVPTAPRCYTVSEILADPIALNARLGTYTNFANFADMSALAFPKPGCVVTGFRQESRYLLPPGTTGPSQVSAGFGSSTIRKPGRREVPPVFPRLIRPALPAARLRRPMW